MMVFGTLMVAYLLGSIPTAYLAGRWLKGIDIREHGSGNVGATNVMRVINKPVGITVLLLDACKGYVAVAWVASLSGTLTELLPVLCGLAAVGGHSWPVFLRFRGGKGVATGAGVFVGLAPQALLFALIVWGACVLILRYVSLASMVAAISLPGLVFWTGGSLSVMCLSVVVTLLVLYRHRANWGRIQRGEEPKIGGSTT